MAAVVRYCMDTQRRPSKRCDFYTTNVISVCVGLGTTVRNLRYITATPLGSDKDDLPSD